MDEWPQQIKQDTTEWTKFRITEIFAEAIESQTKEKVMRNPITKRQINTSHHKDEIKEIVTKPTTNKTPGCDRITNRIVNELPEKYKQAKILMI